MLKTILILLTIFTILNTQELVFDYNTNVEDVIAVIKKQQPLKKIIFELDKAPYITQMWDSIMDIVDGEGLWPEDIEYSLDIRQYDDDRMAQATGVGASNIKSNTTITLTGNSDSTLLAASQRRRFLKSIDKGFESKFISTLLVNIHQIENKEFEFDFSEMELNEEEEKYFTMYTYNHYQSDGEQFLSSVYQNNEQEVKIVKQFDAQVLLNLAQNSFNRKQKVTIINEISDEPDGCIFTVKLCHQRIKENVEKEIKPACSVSRTFSDQEKCKGLIENKESAYNKFWSAAQIHPDLKESKVEDCSEDQYFNQELKCVTNPATDKICNKLIENLDKNAFYQVVKINEFQDQRKYGFTFTVNLPVQNQNPCFTWLASSQEKSLKLTDKSSKIYTPTLNYSQFNIYGCSKSEEDGIITYICSVNIDFLRQGKLQHRHTFNFVSKFAVKVIKLNNLHLSSKTSTGTPANCCKNQLNVETQSGICQLDRTGCQTGQGNILIKQGEEFNIKIQMTTDYFNQNYYLTDIAVDMDGILDITPEVSSIINSDKGYSNIKVKLPIAVSSATINVTARLTKNIRMLQTKENVGSDYKLRWSQPIKIGEVPNTGNPGTVKTVTAIKATYKPHNYQKQQIIIGIIGVVIASLFIGFTNSICRQRRKEIDRKLYYKQQIENEMEN